MADTEFEHLPPVTWVDSPALEIQRTALAAPGQLYAVWVTNTDVALRYFQLHDLAVPLTGAEVPKVIASLAAGESKLVNLGRRGRKFSTGIVWGLSTTAATFTATGAVAHASVGFEAD